MKIHKLEGVRPGTTTCDRCGYVVKQIAIKGGVVMCPECGRPIPYFFSGPDEGRLRRVEFIRRLIWIIAGVVLVLIVGIMEAARWWANRGP